MSTIGSALTCLVLLASSACRDAEPKPFDPERLRIQSVEIPGGEFLARRLYCAPKLEHTDRIVLPDDVDRPERVSPQRVATFRIDRSVATCDEYLACVGAGACPAFEREWPLYCSEGVAVAPIGAARRYCEWRRGRLPTFLEWQRAVRGVRGDRYPNGAKESDQHCFLRTSRLDIHPRCVHTSAAGVSYARHTINVQEWLRDEDCYDEALGWSHGPVGIDLISNELYNTRTPPHRVAHWARAGGEFRCVDAAVAAR